MSVRVKICGLTKVEDAQHAEACGAHALGFIFHDHSPRGITPDVAEKIIASISPTIVTVGVFVTTPLKEINMIADSIGLDRVQLHGGQDYDCLASLNRRGYRAFRLKDESQVEETILAPDEILLLDTYDHELSGGTGRISNWEWARRISEKKKVILAGGLNPENVIEAIEIVDPFGVDVSSGLEFSPGEKDHELISAFFTALDELEHKY
ncbi:MAG: phosphoribosylanthranilate isomerase [Deltaproteobacteria bacterium]|nr:phosphoribosylanthranilate isomerase [Deltaproteobacteria bacterium]